MLNKIQLIGRITHDLEKQYVTSHNEQITKIDFQLAGNHKTDKKKTQFIPCIVFSKLAENIHQYLNKGSKVYLEGTLSIQKYTDNVGNKRPTPKSLFMKLSF